uniref:RING-type domain-containing protein n=1 Tax=Meloidogyne enterolobii TaxID=390850 RepID=A0A6V7VBZ4_MELEN|nr:unnamed protein product [Meloidogyne enterolobii]
MHCKYVVSYKFGCCIICQSQLNRENIYILKNCNHTYHYECITRWITEGSKNCPCCRVPATLDDIKKIFVEAAGDSSDDSDDDFTQSSCSMTKADFVRIKNKWSEINCRYTIRCCSNKCITTKIGNCIEGNEFGNVINDENVKYFVGESGCNRIVCISAENLFDKPQNSSIYSLYYFEIKCKFEGELNKGDKWMYIGLRNLCSYVKHIDYSAKCAKIKNEKGESFELSTSFNNNDIFGCGLVYPPTNKLNEEFPYVFFTQNGKQIGKGILLKENSESYKPHISIESCSVEANFGSNLKTKPFKYNISKHLILKEFY